MVDIISCPTCGRFYFDMERIVKELAEFTKDMKFPLQIAILGCAVNGTGKEKDADVGIAGGIGSGIFIEKGKIIKAVKEENFVAEVKGVIDKYYNEYKINNLY